jgi:hypothetical protein
MPTTANAKGTASGQLCVREDHFSEQDSDGEADQRPEDAADDSHCEAT